MFSNTANWKNYEVKINAIDAKTFEIEVKYLNTADSNGYIGIVNQPNLSNVFEKSYGSGTSVYDTGKNIGIYVDIENITAEAKIQSSNNYWCETAFSFNTLGFQAMQDMVVNFSSTDPISQSYYVGFYREDTINNYENVVDSLGLNYAFVNSGVMLVDMLPNTCITAATNIVSIGGVSQGSVTIDKACLEPNGTYRMYIVYKHLGEWHSCLSEPLKLQGAAIPVIEPTIGYLTTDAFGNVYTDGCIKGLPAQGFITMCTIIDRAALDAAITANGYSGDAEDYLQSVGVTIGGQSVPYVIDKSLIQICANVNTDNFIGSNTVRFEVVMNYGDHTDVYKIEMPLEVISNEIELDGEFLQDGNEITEICEEDGDITLNFTPLGGVVDALLGQDGYYGNNGIISETDGSVVIDNGFLTNDSEYCVRIIKTDIEPGGGNCECPPCPLITQCSMSILTIMGQNTSIQMSPPSLNSVPAPGTWTFVATSDLGTFSTSTFTVFVPNPIIYEYLTFNVTWTNSDNGCIYHGIATILNQTSITSQYFPTPSTTYQDCECPPDPDPNQCLNSPSITYSCDEETQTITASSSGTATGSATDELKYSLTGTNYQTWGGSITGQSVVYLKRSITFSNGCPPIEVNETVFCSMTENCDNELEVEYTLTPTLLTITETQTINSPIHNDSGLMVSIDGGVTFNEYTSPITLVGGEEIVITHTIEFSDSCPPINIIKTDVNDGAGTCDYEQFELFCEYNMATTLFSADFNGDEAGLTTNNKKYSIDGGNTYSPYTGSVAGANMFLIVWEIAYPGCEKQTLIKACCKPSMLPTDEDGCLKVCIDGPIQVELPQQPIEVCLVECCDGFDPILECIDKILSVTNAPAGATFAWSGPSGFSATGNPIDLTGQAEGTYYVSVTDTSTSPPCVSNGQYQFDMPNAGTPISDPIIII